MTDYPPTGGVLLAGGLARRMGGGDKPLVELAGRPLLDHVIARLGPQVDALLLSINGDVARFAAWRLAYAPDPIPGHVGPLAGVLAGMEHFAGRGMRWVVTVAADTPFIPTSLVAGLHRVRGEHRIAVACSGGRMHPTIALYDTALAADLREALLEGERKVERWIARHGAARADWMDWPVDPFFNVNTPEDVARAEELAARA